MDTDWSDTNQVQAPASARFKDYLFSALQYLLPQRLSAYLVYKLSRVQVLWIKNVFIRAYIAFFAVDMSEAAQTDPQNYPTFNHFFTRPLRPGARPIAPGEKVACCPVDGAVSQIGMIQGDTLFQAKGRYFSLTELLGGDSARATDFYDGRYITLYLSPRDYHRVHMPIGGQLQHMVHVPGKLFSVSPPTTRVLKNLFIRNERIISFFDTAAGPMALALIGAFNVGSIETVWAGAITPPLGTRIRCWNYPVNADEQPILLSKGAEMGRFNMGSAVIVLFAKNAVVWEPNLGPQTRVQMGQRLGTLQSEGQS